MNLYDYLETLEREKSENITSDNRIRGEPEYLPRPKLEMPGPNVYEASTEELHVRYEKLLREYVSARNNMKSIKERIDDIEKQLSDCAFFKKIKED